MDTKAFLDKQIKDSGLSRKEWYWQVYLKSDHWHNTRELKLDFSGRFCANCQSKEQLDVHHKNYKNIFDVTVFDLEVLCRRCHNAEHGKVQTYRDFDAKTKQPKPPQGELKTMSQIKAFYKAAKDSVKGHWTQKVKIAHDQVLQALKKRGNITKRELKWLDCVLTGLNSQISCAKRAELRQKRKSIKNHKQQ